MTGKTAPAHPRAEASQPVTQGTAQFGALGHHAPNRTVGCDE
jgi:hypothetical protein